MEIVFYVMLYTIIGGITAGCYLYFNNINSKYKHQYDIDDVYLDGLLWPFSLSCLITTITINHFKKGSTNE